MRPDLISFLNPTRPTDEQIQGYAPANAADITSRALQGAGLGFGGLAGGLGLLDFIMQQRAGGKQLDIWANKARRDAAQQWLDDAARYRGWQNPNITPTPEQLAYQKAIDDFARVHSGGPPNAADYDDADVFKRDADSYAAAAAKAKFAEEYLQKNKIYPDFESAIRDQFPENISKLWEAYKQRYPKDSIDDFLKDLAIRSEEMAGKVSKSFTPREARISGLTQQGIVPKRTIIGQRSQAAQHGKTEAKKTQSTLQQTMQSGTPEQRATLIDPTSNPNWEQTLEDAGSLSKRRDPRFMDIGEGVTRGKGLARKIAGASSLVTLGLGAGATYLAKRWANQQADRDAAKAATTPPPSATPPKVTPAAENFPNRVASIFARNNMTKVRAAGMSNTALDAWLQNHGLTDMKERQLVITSVRTQTKGIVGKGYGR
jgi:hypothetical protein